MELTEFPFVLPQGLADPDGTVHREGAMRLATALVSSPVWWNSRLAMLRNGLRTPSAFIRSTIAR